MPATVYKKIADLTASSDVQDSDQAEIQLGNVSFDIGDQVWTEVKNDSTARNYTVLRSTMHVR